MGRAVEDAELAEVEIIRTSRSRAPEAIVTDAAAPPASVLARSEEVPVAAPVSPLSPAAAGPSRAQRLRAVERANTPLARSAEAARHHIVAAMAGQQKRNRRGTGPVNRPAVKMDVRKSQPKAPQAVRRMRSGRHAIGARAM